MGEEKSAAWYDSVYWAGYDTETYYPIYKVVLQILERVKPMSILEIGCGDGTLGHRIIDAGFPYQGIDFSCQAILAAQRKHPSQFRVGNAYSEETYRGGFSCVIAMEVLEHLDDIRVMKLIPPRTRVIFSVPAFDFESHVRTYENTERDIFRRFDQYLEYGGYLEFRLPQTIHLIEARRHDGN